MARLKKTPREEAASEAKKKSAVLKRIYGERVTQPASSVAAATRGTGANCIYIKKPWKQLTKFIYVLLKFG
jgi:hypothetical protein